MSPRFRKRIGRPIRAVRCRCRYCGAHVMGELGVATLGGNCAVCGSYELAVLEDAPAIHGRQPCLV